MWRYQEEYTYRSGEQLFALHETKYPELTKTKSELQLLERLYGLLDVIETSKQWRDVFWTEVRNTIDEMSLKVPRPPSFRPPSVPPSLRSVPPSSSFLASRPSLTLPRARFLGGGILHALQEDAG